MSELVECEVRGVIGQITLNRPKALNALNLEMVRALTHTLTAWRDHPEVQAVVIRGRGKTDDFASFCAGGDIRFFHAAAHAGDPQLDDFFTEEYRLDHLIHRYPKPYVAFMDGVVMGGGMGISQGASHRLVTTNTRIAMPETNIGLFPDVGAGYFLGRCPGYSGEWLALTGSVLDAAQAIALGLADAHVARAQLQPAWDALAQLKRAGRAEIDHCLTSFQSKPEAGAVVPASDIAKFFGHDSVLAIVRALEADAGDWARQTAQLLRQRSPLMLHVALEQIRRARSLTLEDDLRMERDLVRHCFASRHLGRMGGSGETVEGIRALVIDKDQQPQWQPARIEGIDHASMIAPFFESPWPQAAHPLADLQPAPGQR